MPTPTLILIDGAENIPLQPDQAAIVLQDDGCVHLYFQTFADPDKLGDATYTLALVGTVLHEDNKDLMLELDRRYRATHGSTLDQRKPGPG